MEPNNTKWFWVGGHFGGVAYVGHGGRLQYGPAIPACLIAELLMRLPTPRRL
jgi:hypothetical protein